MSSVKSETPSAHPVSEAPYIELLGVAYEVPLQNTAFEKFLDSAHDFFAVNLETGELNNASLENRSVQTELDAHTDRLSQIFDMALAMEKQQAGIPDTHHAVLEVDPATLRVSGNTAAAKLIACELPALIDDLPLDHAALKTIRQAMADPDLQDRIFLATIGDDATQTYLGIVQRSLRGDKRPQISFSYVSWSPNLLKRLGDAFGLTSSETEILAGYLSNKTQKEIADLRGRSPETIKAQSKSILRKAGCVRIADVIQLSAGIAYMLRQMPAAANDTLTPDILTNWVTPRDNLHLHQHNGRSVAYYKHGTGKRLIVFLHALIQGPYFDPAFLERLDAEDTTLIAPSRPGYGYSDKARSDRAFEDTALSDALAIIEAHGQGDVHIVAQQLGTSHGARLANALGARAASLILINGGIPLRQEHYAGMDRRVRFMAMAAKHAPSVLKLANALGIRSFKQKGVRFFLEDRYGSSDTDMEALQNPDVVRHHALGLFHACEQGVDVFLKDELSKHADWSSDLEAVLCPQFWLQPEDCRIVKAEDVREVTSQLRNAQFMIEPNCGSILLYDRPARVADFILGSMRQALSAKKA